MSTPTSIPPPGSVTLESAPPAEFARDHADDFLADYPGHWWVLHTRPRNEKAVATDLERLGIRNFLPLRTNRRAYHGRILQSRVPLFPGYVFLCGSDDERLAALRTNRVANILTVSDQATLRRELGQIHRVVESEEAVDLYPRLREGARCRVISGTLQGIEGVVLKRRGPWKVFLGVEFVGQSAELHIDPALLEIID